MPQQRFVMHAEGTPEDIEELIACMSDDAHVPHFAYTGAYEVTDLDPRHDNTRLVEISGEIPSDIENDLNAWWRKDDEPEITSLDHLCWDRGMTVEIVTEQSESKPYYADLWYRTGQRDTVRFRLLMRENNWRVFRNILGDDGTFDECIRSAALPANTQKDSPTSPGLIGYVHWFDEFEGEYTSSYDDNDAYGHDGFIAGTSPRRSRGAMNIVVEDSIGHDTLDGLAYVAETNAYYARRPWKLANISTHYAYLHDAQKLRRVAIDWGEATKDDHVVEIHQLNTQGGNTEIGRGTDEIVVESVVPAKERHIRTNGYLLGKLFLNIEFAYDGDEPMEARKLEMETRRAIKAIKKDRLIDDSKGIAFLRMCQRPAKDAGDVGVHVCCVEMDDDFLQEWKRFGEHYGHPMTTTTTGMMRN